MWMWHLYYSNVIVVILEKCFKIVQMVFFCNSTNGIFPYISHSKLSNITETKLLHIRTWLRKTFKKIKWNRFKYIRGVLKILFFKLNLFSMWIIILSYDFDYFLRQGKPKNVFIFNYVPDIPTHIYNWK